ncbi:hypothetical protein [Bacillus sp. NPDC094106]|uniref:hypothetical protein n=1 Tax=Bacillus sp. NPDC094106 TaxID=3363949 RepID=UPI0038111ED3
MKATNLFKELGYIQNRNDDDYIIYSKTLKNDIKKEVLFSYQLQNFKVYYEDVIHSEQYPSVDMRLFNAIQHQLLELRWIM